MLAWLTDLIRPIRRSDPQFGDMRYLRDTRTWDGWISFQPTGGQVEVLLSGQPEGPDDAQRAFVHAIQAQYDVLWPEVELELRAAASADPACLNAPRFVLKGIDLPDEPGPASEWELLYESEPPSWFFAVQLSGWKAINVSIEC